MAITTARIGVRIDVEIKDKIDSLAKVLGRPRNYLIAEAIKRYIEEDTWQIAEIEAGIAEDDAGLHVPHEEVLRDAYAAIEAAETRRSS